MINNINIYPGWFFVQHEIVKPILIVLFILDRLCTFKIWKNSHDEWNLSPSNWLKIII